MKILIISCFFAPRIGGIEKYSEQIAKNLSETNNVHVATSEKNAFLTADSENYTLHYLPYKKISRYHIPRPIITYRLLKQIHPNKILINGPLPYATIIAIINKFLRFPIVLTYHGDNNPKNPILRFLTLIDRISYRFLFNKIITTSDRYKKRVSKFFPKSRIFTIPLGIEPEFFEKRKKKNHSKKQILFVGRLDSNHYYKGIKNFIETSKKLPEYNFIVIGSGSKLKKLQKQSSQNLHFLGQVSQEELIDNYHNADLLVLPSESSSEGFGIVLLEAAACGTPVITTEKAGSSEFIRKEKIGLTIKSNSPAAIKNAIQKLLKDPKLYKEIEKNCYQTTKRLTWENSSIQTFSVLRQQ